MFSDIHHQDFVGVTGHVARRQLNQLILSPYQMSLLERSVHRHGEFDEAEDPSVLM